MKKIILIAIFALCLACDKRHEKPENTLANSVRASGYSMEGEWSFDGVSMQLTGENSFIEIDPVNDTSITLHCGILTEDRSNPSCSIILYRISLSGEPGDVSFYEQESLQLTERYNETVNLVHDPVTATVDGWIKKESQYATRLGLPVEWPYNCDINIECEVEGKSLKLHITRMNSYGYY